MNKWYPFVVGLALLSGIPSTTLGADVWSVQNNKDDDLTVEIVSRTGAILDKKNVKVGTVERLKLGVDEQMFRIWPTNTPEYVKSSKLIALRRLADNGVAQLSKYVSPIDIALPNGQRIYQVMDGFPLSDAYRDELKRLRQSTWSGTYGRESGTLTLEGKKGSAGKDVELTNVQYIPGDKLYIIAGNWNHGDRDGEFILMINPMNPTKLEGKYRDAGKQWLQGTATRR